MGSTDGGGADRAGNPAPKRTAPRRARTAMLAGGVAAVLVIIFAASMPRGPVHPGAANRLEPTRGFTYQRQVLSNPGLAKTETFASLGCYPGDLLLSGGYSGVDEGTLITANGPDSVSSEEAWLVGWRNDDSSDAVDVRVLCLDQSFFSRR